MRSIQLSNAALAVALLLPWTARAQDQGPAIQKKLESEYRLTKINDQKSDIVTAGSVLVLHKDKVLMVTASSATPCMNTYRDGKITASGVCNASTILKKCPKWVPGCNAASSSPATHAFVSGEKFWLTRIEVKTAGKDNGVVLDFFTDPIEDVRYASRLTIPFGAFSPAPDDVLKLVSEVVSVAPSNEDSKQPAPQGGQQQVPAPVPAPPPAPAPVVTEKTPPPLEAPPPPPADPVEVSEGQTQDQVIAAMGQPLKKAKVGAKEIYTYKDMKITFVNGKVKDVQ